MERLKGLVIRTVLLTLSALTVVAITQVVSVPKTKIEKSKDLATLEDQTFDPAAPPSQKPPDAAAFTNLQIDVTCAVGASASITDDPLGICVVEVTVDTLKVTVGGTVQMFLPNNADQTLTVHEAGHPLIGQDMYDAVAKKVIEKVFSNFPAKFTLTVYPCSPEERDAKINARLKELSDTFSKTGKDEIQKEINKVGDAYDSTTHNGTQGADGSAATPENQKEAAKDALKEGKRAFIKSTKNP